MDTMAICPGSMTDKIRSDLFVQTQVPGSHWQSGPPLSPKKTNTNTKTHTKTNTKSKTHTKAKYKDKDSCDLFVQTQVPAEVGLHSP